MLATGGGMSVRDLSMWLAGDGGSALGVATSCAVRVPSCAGSETCVGAYLDGDTISTPKQDEMKGAPKDPRRSRGEGATLVFQ